MAYFEPPKGLKGVQIDFNRFQFSWDSAGNDQRAHFLWIYKEDEMNMPQMIKYSQCMDNRVQVTFQYSSVPLQEIRKIRFLAFLSDEQRLPSRNDLYHMVQKPEFLCEVCCGTGEILWQWKQEAQGMKLTIDSEKKLPEGVLYFEYPYGNKIFQFDIPGEIQCGTNYYEKICFPALTVMPQLKSREANVNIMTGNGKKAGKISADKNNGGFFKKITEIIRHS